MNNNKLEINKINHKLAELYWARAKRRLVAVRLHPELEKNYLNRSAVLPSDRGHEIVGYERALKLRREMMQWEDIIK